jgi:DNA repair protein RecO (recombination protein O)
MSRELSYQAIIIKRQPFGEGDEILTVFTQERGKLRALAKSTKFAKSKLKYGLQTLFLASLTLTSSSGLPKIIRVEVKNPFRHILDRLLAAKMAFYVLELVLKFTADEQKNERLFSLVTEFFSFLDTVREEQDLGPGLAKFKIEFLESMGLGVHYEEAPAGEEAAGFSVRRGGFVFREAGQDYQQISANTFPLFLTLKKTGFNELPGPQAGRFFESLAELQELLSAFIRFHLEREIKSEKFLRSEDVV